MLKKLRINFLCYLIRQLNKEFFEGRIPVRQSVQIKFDIDRLRATLGSTKWLESLDNEHIEEISEILDSYKGAK